MFKRGKSGHHRSLGGHHGRDAWYEEDPLSRGRHRGRAFEYGKLRFVVLQLIAEKASHGYEIIKAIEDRTEGAYVPSPGVVYPTLTLLEDMGYIAAGASDENRKLYKLTTAGRKFLTENKAVVDEVNARLSAAASSRNSLDTPQIVRAMHNLKTALRLKLSEAELSTAQVQAIAAALDAAATNIERL